MRLWPMFAAVVVLGVIWLLSWEPETSLTPEARPVTSVSSSNSKPAESSDSSLTEMPDATINTPSIQEKLEALDLTFRQAVTLVLENRPNNPTRRISEPLVSKEENERLKEGIKHLKQLVGTQAEAMVDLLIALDTQAEQLSVEQWRLYDALVWTLSGENIRPFEMFLADFVDRNGQAWNQKVLSKKYDTMFLGYAIRQVRDPETQKRFTTSVALSDSSPTWLKFALTPHVGLDALHQLTQSTQWFNDVYRKNKSDKRLEILDALYAQGKISADQYFRCLNYDMATDRLKSKKKFVAALRAATDEGKVKALGLMTNWSPTYGGLGRAAGISGLSSRLGTAPPHKIYNVKFHAGELNYIFTTINDVEEELYLLDELSLIVDKANSPKVLEMMAKLVEQYYVQNTDVFLSPNRDPQNPLRLDKLRHWSLMAPEPLKTSAAKAVKKIEEL